VSDWEATVPRKAGGEQLHLVVPPEMKRWIEETAAADHRSVNGQVIALLELGRAYRHLREQQQLNWQKSIQRSGPPLPLLEEERTRLEPKKGGKR
jgi:hypothetical protein